MTERIRTTIEGDMACITLDDGKANAMSTPWFEELGAALDRVEREGAKALVLRGRERFFSGGLDLKLLPTLDPVGMRALTQAFARTMLRVFTFPVPTAAAITGHAMAGGAVLAFACDLRFAQAGAFRLQLNEVAIGIPLPSWMALIARHAVPPRWQVEALLHARSYAPDEALARGLVDGVAAAGEDPETLARTALAGLAGLSRPAYAESKRRLREREAGEVLALLEHETLGPPTQS